jgi:hypothetical protein
MNELHDIDPTFNEAMFITKVNNIFVMLHSAIMMDDLDRVRHFISNELEAKYESLLNDLNKRNVRQMYDELNVKSTNVTFVEIKDNKIKLHVDLVSRYMDYLVDKDSNVFISGINNERVTKLNHLILEKMLGSSYSSNAQKCPGCGANIDVNNSGKCPYCGAIFDAEKHDWILISIETIDI